MRSPIRCLRDLSRLRAASRFGGGRAGLSSVTGGITDTVYCTDASNQRGTSPILLGLVEYFQRQTPNVGFFQPIGASPLADYTPHPGAPKHAALMKQTMGLKEDIDAMYGVSEAEAKKLVTQGRFDELLDRVFTKFQAVKRANEVVVLEGATVRGLTDADFQARIAAELDTPVLMVVDVNRDAPGSPAEVADRVLRHRNEMEAARARILAAVLNKVPLDVLDEMTTGVGEALAAAGLPLAGAIPFNRVIGTARINEFAEALGANRLYGRAELVDSDVTGIMVAPQRPSDFLEKLASIRARRQAEGQEFFRPLVLTSKDRQDLLMSLALASISGTGPQLGGLVLTDGDLSAIPPATHAVLSKLSDDILPVLEVPLGTFEATRRMIRVNPGILPSSQRKVREAKQLFAKHVDAAVVAEGMAAPKSPALTPKRFLHQIDEICRATPQRVVLPESYDPRVLAAAAEVAAKGLARVTLLGAPDEVAAAAAKFNVDVSGCDVVDFRTSVKLPEYAAWLVEARKAKGLTTEQALDQLQDLNMYATVMVAVGDADGMVSGATCTTANTIRPALQVLKTPDRKLVSSVFFMCLPDRVLVYGDCAVNVEPTAAELAQIATVSADTAAGFGITPRVAMLSYSTLGSGSGPQVDLVKEAVDLARDARPDLFIEGPIQYDAAVDPAVAATKIKTHSEVAGKATVCIFPDLNTGNNTYKAVQQSTGAIAIGPLMQGLARPVNDLSRGCTVADIVNTVACTAVQAAALKAEGAEEAKAATAA